jgi:type I site-specific restriction endonuclease
VPTAIGLSATLLNDSPFIENMYAVMFPTNLRFMGDAIKKYVDAYAVMYHVENLNHIKTSYSRGGFYSHNAFEESLMKRPAMLKNYTKLVESVVNTTYIKNTRKEKKLVVFASTVDMCTHLAEAFKKTWPHLDIRRYVSADPYENMLDPDIRVTTLGSGSTGHDVPNLTTVILTQAVNSTQSNIQSLGRLRYLDAESTFEFAYFVCVDINTHINYHRSKLVMLRERAKTIRTINTGVVI